MRDVEHPDLRSYLAAERSYYDSRASRIADLTGRLAAESTARIPAGAEIGVGWPLYGFIYRARTPEGRENLQFLRSRSGESSEVVLLDDNITGAATGYVEDRVPSPDGKLLAWSPDISGTEIYQLRVRPRQRGVEYHVDRARDGWL